MKRPDLLRRDSVRPIAVPPGAPEHLRRRIAEFNDSVRAFDRVAGAYATGDHPPDVRAMLDTLLATRSQLEEAFGRSETSRSELRGAPPSKEPRLSPIEREVLRALGIRIRDERRSRAVTQAGLARSVGVTLTYLSLIERGRRNPPYTTVIDIARALDVPLSRLVDISSTPRSIS
jgi:DNA-binding XRE family transcriptional regulator